MNPIWKPRVWVLIRYLDYPLPRLHLLVDSGADITVLRKSEGNLIGMTVQPGETPMLLRGFSGEQVRGYQREVTMHIAGRTFRAPVCWAETDEVSQVLGRATVFDLFDINIRQADQRVIFWWRTDWRYWLWRSLERAVLGQPPT